MISQQRIAGIDAARGCAMVLVCCSHVKDHFTESAPALYHFLTAVTRVATPTFLLLSGFVIAHLLSSSQRGVGLKLVDRALFLLIVAHVLIGWSDFPGQNWGEWLFGRVVITDAIGVSLLVAVLARNGSTGFLFATGATLALLSWPIGVTASVEGTVLPLLGAVLFSLQSVPNHNVDVALLPYLGVFLVGMGLGRQCERALKARDGRAIALHLIQVGSLALLIVLILLVLWFAFRSSLAAHLQSSLTHVLRLTIDPRSKWPPSPGYLLFYAGAGLLMAGAFLLAERRLRPLVSVPATIGRASLMAFVVQDWLLRALPRLFGFAEVTSVAFWAAYLVVVLAVIYTLARRWDAVEGNRFLTVGLRAWSRRREKKKAAFAGSIVARSRP